MLMICRATKTCNKSETKIRGQKSIQCQLLPGHFLSLQRDGAAFQKSFLPSCPLCSAVPAPCPTRSWENISRHSNTSRHSQFVGFFVSFPSVSACFCLAEEADVILPGHPYPLCTWLNALSPKCALLLSGNLGFRAGGI